MKYQRTPHRKGKARTPWNPGELALPVFINAWGDGPDGPPWLVIQVKNRGTRREYVICLTRGGEFRELKWWSISRPEEYPEDWSGVDG